MTPNARVGAAGPAIRWNRTVAASARGERERSAVACSLAVCHPHGRDKRVTKDTVPCACSPIQNSCGAKGAAAAACKRYGPAGLLGLAALDEVQDYCARQIDLLWAEVKRFENPHTYYVDLSPALWKVKHDLLEALQN